MNERPAWLLGVLLVFVSLSAVCLPADEFAVGEAPTIEQVRAVIEKVRQHTGEMNRAGEPLDRDQSPARTEILRLWQLGRASPGSPAGKLATEESIHLLVHLERHAEAADRAAALGAAEPAWPRVLEILFEGGTLSGDYGPVIRHAEQRLRSELSGEDRAGAWFMLGTAHHAGKRQEMAVSAFRTAIDTLPDSQIAQRAEGYLQELLHLNPGQPAPQFRSPELAGGFVALDDYRGKVVLMSVWASW